MYHKTDLETVIAKLVSLKNKIMSEMRFDGMSSFDQKAEMLDGQLREKNMMIAELYHLFDGIQTEMERITALADQPPEGEEPGAVYTKRR